MKRLAFTVTAAALIMMISCGKKEKEIAPPYDLAVLSAIPYQAENLLPGDIDSVGVKFVGDVRTIKADSAAAHLGASAEQYLVYQMVGITAAKYSRGDKPVYVEIAQFADYSAAYGHYARTRPDGTPVFRLGAEAYITGNTLYMARGEYVTTISCEDDSEESLDVAKTIAAQIAAGITDNNFVPRFFILFPFSGKINPSGQYHPYQYLGAPGVNQVYTVKYGFDTDTLTLFIARDDKAEMFGMMNDFAASLGAQVTHPANMSLLADSIMAFDSDTYGTIIAGHTQEKLIGAVGYIPEKHARLVTVWFKGLMQ
ncbi:MAG: hypothetical protein KAU36_02870 [candidate division Zixibacteria bacterium]|nr:hypothetical protein [candidate division Zixibacteria bacterium]